MSRSGSPLQGILATYRQLLGEIDDWFTTCQDRYPGHIACRRGCSACCRGLFDISLLDAFLLQQGFRLLSAPLQRSVALRCRHRVDELKRLWPPFSPPWLLNRLPEPSWQQMPEDDETPCPLLADSGVCLVYAHRPMICRLHGIPNIDISGEDFTADICSYNFVGQNPMRFDPLRWKFRETFRTEFALQEAFSAALTGTPLRELDTFIPCAPLIDFEATDWADIARRYAPA